MDKQTLVSTIQDYLENADTDFVAYINQFIKLAEEDIYRRVQLKDLRKTDSGALVASTSTYTIPTDLLAPYAFRVTTSGSESYILQKDVEFLREVYPATTTEGLPRFYAFFDDTTFWLAPTPDAAYTVELDYYYKPTSLSAGADGGTTWLSTNGEQALLFGTLLQGYIFMKGDQDVVEMYQAQYEQAIAALKVIAEGRSEKDTYRTDNKRLPV